LIKLINRVKKSAAAKSCPLPKTLFIFTYLPHFFPFFFKIKISFLSKFNSTPPFFFISGAEIYAALRWEAWIKLAKLCDHTLRKDGHSITLTFENYDQYFFYEILTLIKKINVYCFQVITNLTNHNYLFQWNQQFNKKTII